MAIPGARAILAGFLAAALAAACRCSAQDFMVKPMSMDLAARPGESVEKQLEFRNSASDKSVNLTVVGAELGQTPDGGWAVSTAEADSKTRPRSCLKWLSLVRSTVEIRPADTATDTLRIRVPQGARGSFAAALLVRTVPATPEPGKVAIVIQFAIPIIVNIQGPQAREMLKPSDAGIRMRSGAQNEFLGSDAVVQVTNDGESIVHVGGAAQVEWLAGTNWRRLTEVPLPDRSVLPGSVVNLASDLKRRLPSGRYRVKGRISVDGRYKGRIEKEIDFTGDPSTSTAVADVTLGVQPGLVAEEVAPGSRRSVVVQVRNPGTDTLQVDCHATLPAKLSGVAMGNTLGDSFSCAPWIDVLPQTFTLRGGGRQNVRLITVIPEDGVEHPNYYADLMVRASYPDGQSAGETQSLVWVHNTKVEDSPNAGPMGITLTGQGGNSYAVAARFGNVGDTHYTPTAVATVGTIIGEVAAKVDLETASRVVLPLGTPQFSGVIDFTGVKPGDYLLTAAMSYGQDKVCKQSLPIKVSQKGTQKIVTVVERTPQEASPGKTAGKTAARKTSTKRAAKRK